jgi:hypothetical protein
MRGVFNANPALILYDESRDHHWSGKEVVIEEMIAILVGGMTG